MVADDNQVFLKRQISFWENQMRIASELADFKAWSFAERELMNYQQMLAFWQKRMEQQGET